MLVAGVFVAGCTPAKTFKKPGEKKTAEEQPEAVEVSTAPSMESGEADIRGSEFTSAEDIQAIRGFLRRRDPAVPALLEARRELLEAFPELG